MASPKHTLIALLLTVLITTVLFAAESIQTKDPVKSSGGECHTLVLMADKSVWACGDSGYYQLGIGNTTTDQRTLVRVYVPNDANYLEDINDISAGWKHSLALIDYFSLAICRSKCYNNIIISSLLTEKAGEE